MIIYAALCVLLLCLMAIIIMFISLGKQGDERRKLIVEKASAGTFAVTVGYILICVIESLIKSVAHHMSADGMNPFIALAVISVIYIIQLMFFKKKYGD
ncbi:MAG: hypothetical protein KH230_17040 [Enterocloster asparagiformis]|nr:hypothetical protein [Enterocloster asparagiformis]